MLGRGFIFLTGFFPRKNSVEEKVLKERFLLDGCVMMPG